VDGAGGSGRPDRANRVFDGVLVAVVIGIGWAGLVAASSNPDLESAPFTGAMAAVAAASALPLWWRRRWPLAMYLVTIALVVVAGGIDERGLFPLQIVAEAAVLCFAIGAWSERRRVATVLIVVTGALIVAGAASEGGNVLAVAAYSTAVLVLPAVGGYATRTRRQYLEEVEQRLAEAERDRDARARQAVRDERTRIARELHDVVAHHVSLIGVQAGAARLSLDNDPDATRAALAGIDESSRAALVEMRQLLDVLAPVPGDDLPGEPLAPQPTLTDLPTLVARWQGVGVPVTVDVDGDPAGLSPALSLTCYRIVEEALTNVARHAWVRSAHVSVRVDSQRVMIEVVDPDSTGRGGPPPPPDPARVEPPRGPAGGGRGLVGLRERVALFDGMLDVGPCGTGFRVVATLPRSPG
jgi:signal transduction histidine kinase